MRLSEAILLGSLVVKPEARVLLIKRNDGDHGCALGMACKAAGLIQNWENEESLASIYLYWPWTLEPREYVPCGAFCPGMNAAQFIAHVFDYHIRFEGEYASPPVWTLEQLIDWVRAHEPEEAEGQQLIDVQLAEAPHVEAVP